MKVSGPISYYAHPPKLSPRSGQVYFGDEDERLWSRKSLIKMGNKEVIGMIFGVILAPLAHPAKEAAKNLFWHTDDKAPGLVSRKIRNGAGWVRNLFSKNSKEQELQLEEQLEKEAKSR